MREILFRGKRLDNGEWIYGSYVEVENRKTKEKTCAIFEYYDDENDSEVLPSTVGQYTGLTDKNGVKIFEGDIVECWSEGVKARGEVTQRKDGLWIIYPNWQKILCGAFVQTNFAIQQLRLLETSMKIQNS